ncbi:hypothetical protein F2Q69_00053646 [Brassica cretica]|uniref:Uncharacterized protein n=1 Tax=Brassica cretica TaxID=69181 RepID=A0A8S9N7U6_BRACR|nr:hypothetical protein F2Q69_00053646 [Brassica cretica]
MKNDNNIPVDTKNIIQTPLNVATTDATGVTTAGTNTASTTAATTTTTLPVGNGADETTRCSLFSAGLYQTGSVSGTTRKTMKNDNNIPVDTKNIIQTPLNVATTDATGVTTAGTNTASTAAATTTTTLPVGNGADETTRCSLFSADERCCLHVEDNLWMRFSLLSKAFRLDCRMKQFSIYLGTPPQSCFLLNNNQKQGFCLELQMERTWIVFI